MALKPFLTGLVPDISVVPVNLSYDRTLEEVLFAYELLGVPKPKESTKVNKSNFFIYMLYSFLLLLFLCIPGFLESFKYT